jgi:hypothetical protein
VTATEQAPGSSSDLNPLQTQKNSNSEVLDEHIVTHPLHEGWPSGKISRKKRRDSLMQYPYMYESVYILRIRVAGRHAPTHFEEILQPATCNMNIIATRAHLGLESKVDDHGIHVRS